MRKFIIVLCILMLLTPIASAAVKSPVPEKMIKCIPEIEWCFAEDTENWLNILEWLDDVEEMSQGYDIIEALYVTLDKEYEEIQWSLMVPVFKNQKPFVYIIDEEDMIKQEVKTYYGWVVTDFTDFAPKNYYICFFVKSTD